jgi:hypothetical protein
MNDKDLLIIERILEHCQIIDLSELKDFCSKELLGLK